jgi:hypothetical protein
MIRGGGRHSVLLSAKAPDDYRGFRAFAPKGVRCDSSPRKTKVRAGAISGDGILSAGAWVQAERGTDCTQWVKKVAGRMAGYAVRSQSRHSCARERSRREKPERLPLEQPSNCKISLGNRFPASCAGRSLTDGNRSSHIVTEPMSVAFRRRPGSMASGMHSHREAC